MPNSNQGAQATNPMAVTLKQYTAAQSNFQQHYFLDNCNGQIGGQQIQVSWSDLDTVVSSYMSSTGAQANDVALRFVLCYDDTCNELYLRMEICSLTYVSPNYYTLDTSQSVWYAITNGNIVSTGNTDLFDVNYLNYFYYCDAPSCSVASLQNLAADTAELKYVRNLVMPWGLEIQQMYNDNSQNAVSICFSAASFANGGAGGNPGVVYPHLLVVYLLDCNGIPLMDNTQYANDFTMKGCDMGTLCPSNCGVCIIC